MMLRIEEGTLMETSGCSAFGIFAIAIFIGILVFIGNLINTVGEFFGGFAEAFVNNWIPILITVVVIVILFCVIPKKGITTQISLIALVIWIIALSSQACQLMKDPHWKLISTLEDGTKIYTSQKFIQYKVVPADKGENDYEFYTPKRTITEETGDSIKVKGQLFYQKGEGNETKFMLYLDGKYILVDINKSENKEYIQYIKEYTN